MAVSAGSALWLGPSTRPVQALMMAGAAQNHRAKLLAAFAQRLDVMKRHATATFPAEEVAQAALTVA